MSYRSLLATLAILAAPTALVAQEHGAAPHDSTHRSMADSTHRRMAAPDAAARLADLKQRLNLTPDQEAKIKPILQAQADSLKAIGERYKGKTDRSDRRAAMGEFRKVRDDTRAQINPLLTAEQQAEWKKWQGENRDRMREGMKKRRAEQGS